VHSDLILAAKSLAVAAARCDTLDDAHGEVRECGGYSIQSHARCDDSLVICRALITSAATHSDTMWSLLRELVAHNGQSGSSEEIGADERREWILWVKRNQSTLLVPIAASAGGGPCLPRGEPFSSGS